MAYHFIWRDHHVRAKSIYDPRRLANIKSTAAGRLRKLLTVSSSLGAICVDAMIGIDETAFYIDGWVRDEEGPMTSLVAISPEGERTELIQRIFRYRRADLAESFGPLGEDATKAFAFASFFELGRPSTASTGWVLQGRNSNEAKRTIEVPPVVRETERVWDAILARMIYERPAEYELSTHHVFPAISRLQKRLQASAKVDSIQEFGKATARPQVSIVVALYRRIELLEQQLCEFAKDPELHEADIVYVLDSPDVAEQVLHGARHLFEIYGVPFRLVFLERHVGFAGATTSGAAAARGQLLLFLHSDVLPVSPGWLGKMRSFYEATPRVGVLAPKLLFEDGTIQDAGVSFVRPPGSSFWESVRPYVGLHGSFEAARVARRVPAVGGACLMVHNKLFEHHGGLRGQYLQPENEAVDLALRLIQGGLNNWYIPDVELYHLQARVSLAGVSSLNARYDSWLHSVLWNCDITTMDLAQGDR
jgi:O-antigen biosynthesis protein